MTSMTAGGAILARLKALGITHVLANSGTDFPPIIEGLAEAQARGIALPRAVTVPHEHAAMGMALGAWLMTGRPQAVMLHTNVGLANGAIGALNAACEQAPLILMSGRTPVTEGGRFGARSVPIGWGQEMRDQHALVRESVKWDYELRFPEQVGPLLDRALAIAASTPAGPVYLSLPREVLCAPVDPAPLAAPPAIAPAITAPDPAAVQRAARLIAGARAPLVIAQRGAGDEASFAAFAGWVEEWGIAVSSWWATRLAIPTDHPCHVGADPGPALAEADVVIVLDCLAPWWPDRHAPDPQSRIIQIGPDPLYARYPVRGFRSDVTLAGETGLCLAALIDAMRGMARDAAAIAARRERLAAVAARERARLAALAEAGAGAPMSRAWIGHCLSQALEGLPATVFSELGLPLETLTRRDRLSWFQEPFAGGLGWSVPAALGAKMACPDRVIVATPGDGSYIFANPTACHQVAEALGLGVVILVINNGEWGAVRKSVTQLYPDGHAARANRMPLTALEPVPDFTLTARASRAHAETVTDGAALPAALGRALAAAAEGRQALLDLRVAD
ncbi:MAG: acetolactate synthase [Paracoccaceae bacterium]|nr:MAG: acetolactate synthase [Paracoccaceae bacterium]